VQGLHNWDPSEARFARAQQGPPQWQGQPHQAPAAPHRLGALPILHQTVKSLKLTSQQDLWQASWRRLGFRVRTADNAQARRDMVRATQAIGDPALLRVYDALETSVQRADVWRYAILWLDGGVYADIDVYAYPPIAELARSSAGVVFSESLPIFDLLPRALAHGVSWLALALGLTDLVRLPQRRNCIMIAPARHALMRRTLQLLVRKFDAERHLAPQPEPTHTLELTGPGILSDALDQLLDERGGGAEGMRALGMRLVSRFEGMHYFQHVGTGTWKTYLGDAQAHGLKPHERTLRWVVLLMQATGFVLYMLVCTHTRLRLSPCGLALKLVPAAVRQRLGVNAHSAAPVVACCRSRTGRLWRLCDLYQSARQLALQVVGGRRRSSTGRDSDGAETPGSASKERPSRFSGRCPRSGSVPARLGDCESASRPSGSAATPPSPLAEPAGRATHALLPVAVHRCL